MAVYKEGREEACRWTVSTVQAGWIRRYDPISSISLRTKSSEAVLDGKIEEEGSYVSAAEVVLGPRE